MEDYRDELERHGYKRDGREHVEMLRKLEEHTSSGGMVKQYDRLYHYYSQVAHWTPRGILFVEPVIDAALAVSTGFSSLRDMSENINDEYSLGFDDELSDTLGRALERQERERSMSTTAKKRQNGYVQCFVLDHSRGFVDQMLLPLIELA